MTDSVGTTEPTAVPPDRQETFGAMLDAGMSQREIAAATGVGKGTVARSTTGPDGPDVDHGQDESRSTSGADAPDVDHEPDTPPRARPIKDPAPIVALPAGCLPCASCGCPVPTEDGAPPALVATVHGREGIPVKLAVPTRLEFGRCDACTAIEQQAAALLAAHPALLHRVGTIARPRLTTALEALAALGKPPSLSAVTRTPPTRDRPDVPGGEIDAALDALLRHLSVPGGDARYLVRFAPVLATEARPGTCTTSPWAHLKEPERRALRAGYARLLRERVAASAPVVAVPPPPGGDRFPRRAVVIDDGCLLCGRGAVMVPAAAAVSANGHIARDVWTPLLVTYRASQLGGYLCPPCQEAREQSTVLGWGPTLWEAAYLDHLDARGSGDPVAGRTAAMLRAAIADGTSALLSPAPWGALVADARAAHREPPPPSEHRWGWAVRNF